MGKNRKNKLKKKNHNAPKIGNEMTKNLDKHTHSPTYEEIKSSSPNRNIIKLNTIPNNIEITNLIIKKISNFGKATKKWCQIETKNIMNLIKTKKKQLMTQILISAKSACIKLLDAKEMDLKRPTQSKDTPLNITRPNKIKQKNNILNMTPISQSSPYANTNEISKTHQRNISELLENTPKVLRTDTTPSSIKCDNLQDHMPKINIKRNTTQQSKATPLQAPQKLMNLNTKPSRQLEVILNIMDEKVKNNTKDEDKTSMHKKPSATTRQTVRQITQQQQITQQYSDADLINLNSPNVKTIKIEATTSLVKNIENVSELEEFARNTRNLEVVNLSEWYKKYLHYTEKNQN